MDHIKCGSLQSIWWPNGITSNVDLYRAYGGLMDHIKCGSLQSIWWPNGITSNKDLYRAYGGLMGSHQIRISTERMVA